jgi:hypothetical protein
VLTLDLWKTHQHCLRRAPRNPARTATFGHGWQWGSHINDISCTPPHPKVNKQFTCMPQSFCTFLHRQTISMYPSPHRHSEVGSAHCTSMHCTSHHITSHHCTALHCTALHCTALHCTALRCAALHCTALHSHVRTSTASCRILPILSSSSSADSPSTAMAGVGLFTDMAQHLVYTM